MTARVGFFGLLGSGNIGNDGSFESVLGYLRSAHPDVELSCLCPSPDVVSARYGVSSTGLHRYRTWRRAPVPGAVTRVLGRIVDAVLLWRWVARHDVVIVPGTGPLETTLPVGPWGFPLDLLLVCTAGRACGTKVGLVAVGGNVPGRPATRWLLRSAAKLAAYRSFRDARSRESLWTLGVDTSRDVLYPDLTYALPVPDGEPMVAGTVGVGVMDYYGSDEDRKSGTDIHRRYVDGMTAFVEALVDGGRRVVLFGGDRLDDPVATAIAASVYRSRPAMDRSRLVCEKPGTLAELMERMTPAEIVVASRYHNLLCAVKLGKPTLSVSYSAKCDDLMERAGLAEFCHTARAVDPAKLQELFAELERRADALRPTVLACAARDAAGVEQQFAALSAALLPGDRHQALRTVHSGKEVSP